MTGIHVFYTLTELWHLANQNTKITFPNKLFLRWWVGFASLRKYFKKWAFETLKKTNSNRENVLTQTSSSRSQRLIRASALPVAKYLKRKHREIHHNNFSFGNWEIRDDIWCMVKHTSQLDQTWYRYSWLDEREASVVALILDNWMENDGFRLLLLIFNKAQYNQHQ